MVRNMFYSGLQNYFGKALADGKNVGMVLMDLSKAYDCIPHDLLIAKFVAYRSSYCSLLLIHSYLSNSA